MDELARGIAMAALILQSVVLWSLAANSGEDRKAPR
jgi:hypothetical protein